MKILIIYPQPPMLEGKRMFNIGIAYISSVLKTKNHKTFLLNIDSFKKKQLDNTIKKYKPDLICFSSTTDQIELTKKTIEYISKYKIPTIIGGTHSTVFPEDAINVKSILGICIGEGEYAILELVEALENKKSYTKIKNFWFKKGNKIIKNPLRPLIQNLDKLPFPDRELFNYKELLKNHKAGIEFMAGRGCPYQCTYCVNKKLQDLYKNKGKFVRYRSVNNLIKEIKQTIKRYPTKLITFHDDTFTLNKKWLKEFSEKYSKEIKIPFRCNARADTIDEEIIKLLKKANCKQIWIGVESGNEKIRNLVLKKNITNQQIKEVFNLAKKYKIKTMAFNMIGIPYETEENIKETFKFNKEINPDLKAINIFRPYPGTELYNLCKKNNWISNRKVHGYYEDTILDQPSVNRETIRYYKELFYPYMTHYRFLPIIKLMIKTKIKNKSIYFLYKTLKSKIRGLIYA
jgi:radical SAM superfamily enzyme YgiQ (UPF0313 family)